MFVLDTDHLSFLEHSEHGPGKRLLGRLDVHPADQVVATIVSYEEQTRGWMAQIARARAIHQQIEAYRRLHRQLDHYRRIPLLDFDEAAAVRFQRLRAARIRIGTSDLKIAAIVLANDATLLSRNLVDFRKVPGLRVEDWTA
jgi:tRNA(fMet)-specific endonuclease VapC